MIRCLLLAVLLAVAPVSQAQDAEPATPAAQGEQALWEGLLAGDHVALLRHAVAPGTGDPAGFSVDDCATQRNLSEGGREQARRIGERFRKNGIPLAAVFSSQWCRCRDTARLLGLGPVTQQPLLNSFFRNFERRDSQTRSLRQWIARQNAAYPLVLVTHQVNITALTDIFPQSGELVILRRDDAGELVVAGTIRTE